MDVGKTDGGRDRETSPYDKAMLGGGNVHDTTRFTRSKHIVYNQSAIVETTEEKEEEGRSKHIVYNQSSIVETTEQDYLYCEEKEEEGRCSIIQCPETYLIRKEASSVGVKKRSSLEELAIDTTRGTMRSLEGAKGYKKQQKHGSSELCSPSATCLQTQYSTQSLVPATIRYLSSFWRKTRWQFTLCIFLGLLTRAQTFDIGSCKAALGMESGAIADSQISASSSHDESVTGPSSARLNVERFSGAWCPKEFVGNPDRKEYLEINLQSVHVISATQTQGRFGNGVGVEYVEKYMLEYKRPGLKTWYTYKAWNGDKVLSGNTNTYTAVENKLVPPIIASKIRFIPYSPHPRTVCMRVELHGCPYFDGLLAYSMPRGQERGMEVDLVDLSFDGTVTDGILYGGLGQLTDGIFGEANFRSDLGHGKGYEWVGWRDDSEKPVEILFEFETVRNFTAIHIFCNNMYSKDVQVFSRAVVLLSVGGHWYNGQPVPYTYMPDVVTEYARNVTIPIGGRVGKYVKLQMYFSNRWIMVSEIFFTSISVDGNFSLETAGSDLPDLTGANSGYIADSTDTLGDKHRELEPPYSDMSPEPRGQEYVALVIGVLIAVILLLVSAILLIVWRARRLKQTTVTHDIYTGPYGEKRDIVNLKLGVEGNGDIDKTGLYSEPFHMTYNTLGGYSTMGQKLQHPPLSSPDYTGSVSPCPPSPAPTNMTQPPQESFYAATEIVTSSNANSMRSGSQVIPTLDDCVPREIPREAITLLQKIGEGQFGEVHLGEVIDEDGGKQMVAVKTLRLEASHSIRCDFEREVSLLARLRDPHIVGVVGICSREEPLCMLVEYMEHGDLNQYLQAHVAETASPRSTTARTLSYGCLIYIATQIASGMKYLEALNFVHRDLATRNCLVGPGHIIKISDFGMSRNLYSGDYYRIEGKALLPIRWMAWESILLGKFTTKSDVWSFAVTLWEILTMAREQPYEEMTDEVVIENVSYIYHNDTRKVMLPQPTNCPKEIYDLMRECWKRSDADRPSFREIHMFLQRKNLGYSPAL